MILYLKDPKDCTKKLFDLAECVAQMVKNLPSKFSPKPSTTKKKINIQVSVDFLYTNNEKAEKEIRKTISFTITSKNTWE
jgi:hypothetical protein